MKDIWPLQQRHLSSDAERCDSKLLSACGPLSVTQLRELTGGNSVCCWWSIHGSKGRICRGEMPFLGISMICYQSMRRGSSLTKRHPSLKHWWDKRLWRDYTIAITHRKPLSKATAQWWSTEHCMVFVVIFVVCLFWFFNVGSHMTTSLLGYYILCKIL